MADRLGEIMKKTLLAIETGKEEIFHIAETSRTETQRLTQELAQLRMDISETIKKVDQLHKLDRKMRQHLMEVSRDFKNYSEKEMIESYENAKETQVQLQLYEAKEYQIRTRRDEIERSLKQMMVTIERAENLMSQISLAINLLQSGINEMTQDQNLEKQQEVALRIIMAQEEERRRVAREIHDGPAQNLANIVLRLEITEKLLELDPKQAKTELQDLKTLVRSNLQDIRRIIFDLRPMALDDLGIISSLRRYMDNFQSTYKIECEFIVQGREKRLPPAMEVAIFRLIQEAMTNVAKHAHSEKVKIELSFKEDMTIARIIDFGQGFDFNAVLENPGEHFGLIGMKERVEMFSGQFSIISPTGVGTTIELSIPYKKEENLE